MEINIYFQRIFDAVFKEPTEFFHEVEVEKNKKNVLLHLFLCLLMAIPLHYAVYVILSYNLGGALTFGEIIYTGVFASFLDLIQTFLHYLMIFTISHVIVYIFGGKRGILETFKSYVYGLTPFLILQPLNSLEILPITVLVFVILLWRWYVVSIGLGILHRLGRVRALLATLLNYIITSIVMSIFWGILSLLLFGTVIS